VNIFSTSFPLCNHTHLYDCYFIFIMQGQQSLRVFQCSVKNIWMPVEFQRIKVGGCTSPILQVLTRARHGNFPNYHWSAYYTKTPFAGICEIKCYFHTLTEVFCTLTEVFLTLTELFPCFFLSCKANARVKLAKMGHSQHSSKLVVIYVVPYYVCLNVYCTAATGWKPNCS
jgi:hypothetical protein